MDIELSSEQRDRLELISLHAGKSVAQILLESALFLLERDAASSTSPDGPKPQKFLSEQEMEARFARLLRR